MFDSLMLAFEDAHAATAAPHMEPVQWAWLPPITALVVFLAAFVVLYLKVWPQIIKGLDDRDNKIRQEIASAEAAREKANNALKEYEQSLADAREEAGRMIAKAREDAKAAADELRTRNDAELTELKTRARREIESAKQAAISEIHAEAANLATAAAAKILQRELNAGDQQSLVEQSLKELATAQRN